MEDRNQMFCENLLEALRSKKAVLKRRGFKPIFSVKMNMSQTLFTNTDTKLDNSQKRSRLAVTLGDPAGIGTEVVLKALAYRR